MNVPLREPVPRAELKLEPAGIPEAVNVSVLVGSASVALTLKVRELPMLTIWGPGTLITGAGVRVIDSWIEWDILPAEVVNVTE